MKTGCVIQHGLAYIRPYIIHRVSQYSRHNRQVLVFYIHITYLVPYSFYTSSSIYYILTSSSNFQTSTPTKAILFVLNFNKVIIRVYVSTKISDAEFGNTCRMPRDANNRATWQEWKTLKRVSSSTKGNRCFTNVLARRFEKRRNAACAHTTSNIASKLFSGFLCVRRYTRRA